MNGPPVASAPEKAHPASLRRPRPKDLLRHLVALCVRVVAGDSRRQIDYLLEENRILKQALR